MFRRWFRSNSVRIIVLSSPFLLCAFSVHAGKLPTLLEKIETKYKAAVTLMAAFTQVNESAIMKERKSSSGVISVKKPGKMRWETQSPDPSIFISDSRTMWFYTPPFDKGESGQLVIRKSSNYQSKLAGALLAGDFTVASDLKIKQKNKNTFLLTPKPGSAGDVLDAELSINSEKLLIEKVVLKHKGGNLTEITLSKILLGQQVDEEMFHFTPPPKTDIVKE